MIPARANARSSAVSLLRIVSTLMILVCHTVRSNTVATLMTAAIPVFLMISGYLYGPRELEPRSFLKKRYLQITFPGLVFFIAMAVWFAFHAPNRNILPAVVLQALNLQGVYKMFDLFPNVSMGPGVGHLWFVTPLMLCYLLMLPLKKRERTHTLSTKGCILFLVFSTLLSFTGGLPAYKLRFSLIQIFFVGYMLARRPVKANVRNILLCTAALAICTVPMQLLLRYAPDSGWYVGAGYCWRNLIAFWLFFVFLFFQERFPRAMDRLADNRIVRHLDALSYYVFITHYIYSDGPFAVTELPIARPLQLLAFAALTFVTAEALRLLCKPVIRRFTRRPVR